MTRQFHIILCAVYLLFPLSPAYAEDHSDDWFNCKSDNDCIAVDDCGRVLAINKNYKSEAEQYYAQEHATQNCLPGKPPSSIKCRPQKMGCKNWFGGIDPAADCVGLRCIVIYDEIQ